MATIEQLSEQRERLEVACAKASKTLKSFPKTFSGLTTDAARNDPAYKTARLKYGAAFNELRSFNQRYAKLIRGVK